MISERAKLPFRKLKAAFSLTPRALHVAWQGAPGWTLSSILLLVVQGLIPAALVVLAKYVVDAAVAAIEAAGSWADIQALLIYALLLASVMLVSQVADSIARWVQIAQAELVGDHIRALVHEKSAVTDYAYYESPEYFDELYRVLEESQSRPLGLLTTIGAFLRDAISIGAMAAVLLPYGLWLPAALVLSTAPAFWVMVRYNREYHNWWHDRTEDFRKSEYYDEVLTHSLTAAEVRVFGLRALYQPAYQAIRKLLRNERIRLEKRQVYVRLLAALFGLVVVALCMGWMTWRVIEGDGSLGDLALFYQAFSKGQALMRALLGGVGEIHEHSLFLRHLFEFIDRQPTIVRPEVPVAMPVRLSDGIQLRDLSFAYPESDETVVERFNLFIPAGKVVAVVGENGAGKTTVFKLVARLYDPVSGSVEIDGVDIRTMDPDDLRSRMTAVFQLPVNYHATAAESIMMGDLSRSSDSDRMTKAAIAAGIHDRILRLPNGYDTQLGKWFTDGHELSGGEWQRMALARAFYRDAPILLLDEPTSRMDSWSEADWFERFRKHAKGRTALLITHRFAVARNADLIVVMKDGVIVEQGTHDELIQSDGAYSSSWARHTNVKTDLSGHRVHHVVDETTQRS